MTTIIEFLNRTGGGFCHHALWMFVQVSVLVGIVWGLDVLLRRRIRASVRYCIWLLVLLKLVLPVDLRLPSGVGYWLNLEKRTPAPIRQAITPEASFKTEKIAVTPPAAAVASTDTAPEVAVAAAGPDLSEPVTATPALTLRGLLFGGWLLGVVCLLAVMGVQYALVRGLIRRSEALPEDIEGMLRRCQSGLQMRGTIRIRQSEDVGSPAVCGVFRPTILIPSGLIAKLSAEQLEKVLLHELMHIKRYDLWVNLVQNCLQVFYFYNPLLRFANGRIRTAREQANDEQVLVHLKGKREDYSATLIEIAAAAVGRPMLAVRLIGVAEPKTHLHERITLMMQKPIPKTARLGLWGTLTVLLLGLALVPMAGRMQAMAAELKSPDVPAITLEKFLSEAKIAVNTMVKGNQNADAKLSAAAFTADAVVLPAGANPAIGRNEIAALYNGSIERGARVLSADVAFEEIWTSGRYVISIDRSILTARVPELEHLLLIYSGTLYIWEVQADGTLKIKADAWNSLPTPSTEPLLTGTGITAAPQAFHTAENSHMVPDASANTLEKVKQLDRQLHADCLKADAELLASYYAPDAIYLGEKTDLLRGRDAIKANATAMYRQLQFEDLGHRILFAEGTEEMVYVVNRFEWKFKDVSQGDQTFTFPGKGMHVWQKQPDGNWKIRVDINSSNVEQ